VPGDAPLSVVVWGSATAVVPLALATLATEGLSRSAQIIGAMSVANWLGIAFQAGPTTLVAFGIWAWLLRQHPASLIAPFTLLVPVVGMTCAVWLLDEPVTWWKLAGAALVLSGLGLNVLASRRR